MAKKILSKISYLVITFLFFTYVNGVFSNLIVASIKGGFSVEPNAFVVLNYVKNTGAAFSILENSTDLLIGISIAVVIIILYYLLRCLKSIPMKEILLYSLLLAGVVGNLYERIMLGFVRDYFQFTFINFPVFNISDIFITLGIFGIIILTLLKKS
jgi:signal peptidase II